MRKTNLLVFCGPVGSGKSTLIKKFLKKHPDFVFFDIFNYIKKYKDKTGHIKLRDSLKAHRELYCDLIKVKKSIVLELGTNRAKLNFTKIYGLSNKFRINIILCLLDKKICRQRMLVRGENNPKRIINVEDLEKKFKRPFPSRHRRLAKKLGLSFIELDMGLLFKERLQIINGLTTTSRR